jgi:hypothetical protein
LGSLEISFPPSPKRFLESHFFGKPKLGGAVVYVQSGSHYLEFNMAASVQGWRQKWFYIKDQKATASD